MADKIAGRRCKTGCGQIATVAVPKSLTDLGAPGSRRQRSNLLIFARRRFVPALARRGAAGAKLTSREVLDVANTIVDDTAAALPLSYESNLPSQAGKMLVLAAAFLGWMVDG